ncbi:hypothetical protein SAMN05444008_11535 [Cnuella takakiae]|uniref:HNH nuclease domain-containing protein n=1 Tax=Cnuella takakiae TaxID=1302690 RepID=A0A1M5FZH8_9BACT|nr:hypothetical protein SAMN05444008_11535 [Cnuella takakiae]
MPIDYKNYHPKWSLISRMIRVYRAHNRCEWCGARNGHPHPGTGSRVILTVAHIDRNRENNRFWNLAALCQRCHLNHDRAVHIANRKYGSETKYQNGMLFQTDAEELKQLTHTICQEKTNPDNSTRLTECSPRHVPPLPELPWLECLPDPLASPSLITIQRTSVDPGTIEPPPPE